MHAAVIVFPGSNCDRDMAVAFERAGAQVSAWSGTRTQRCPRASISSAFRAGFPLVTTCAAARLPPIRRSAGRSMAHAERGGYVLGICNGFQVLTETGLLPGVLLRNAGLKYICKAVGLKVETSDSAFTSAL